MDPSKLKKDFDYAINWTRLLLLPLGLWSTKSKIYQKFVRPVKVGICFFTMLFVIIPLCLHIFFIAKDLKIRLKLMGSLGFCLMSLFKYTIIIYNDDKVAKCIWHMWNDWWQIRDISERKIMLDNAKTARMLVVVCAIFMYVGGMPYVTVLPLFKGSILNVDESIKPLPYPSYFVLFDPQVRPIYDFIFTLHCICAFIEYTISCGIYSIVIICIMHVCSQITITHRMLDKLVDNFDYQLLGQIINQHQRSLKLASRLEEIFNKICLFDVFGSSCIICLLAYYLITEYEHEESVTLITFSLLLISFVFNIFILCYIAEILTEQCDSIGYAAYMTDWYRLSQRDAKNIILLIISTQCPVYLTAGKIFNLSILSFSNEYENRETVALVTYLLLLVSFVFNIFILCYIGEILTEQCESIGKAAYMTDWHRLPQREAKNIILLIVTTQRPVYLTAGELFNLSIQSFSNVIKVAASYLNLLRTVIDNTM